MKQTNGSVLNHLIWNCTVCGNSGIETLPHNEIDNTWDRDLSHKIAIIKHKEEYPNCNADPGDINICIG